MRMSARGYGLATHALPAKTVRGSTLFALRPVGLERGVSQGISIYAVGHLAHEAVAPKLLRTERVPLRLGVLGIQLLLCGVAADDADDARCDTESVRLA